MSGGTKRKKTEAYGYNFRSLWHTKCSIILSTPKAWCTPPIITKYKVFLDDSERVCVLWADPERRIHNIG